MSVPRLQLSPAFKGSVGYDESQQVKTRLTEAARRGTENHSIKLDRGNEQSLSLRDVEFRYVAWVSEKTSLVFLKGGEILEFLAPKRGNSAYRRRVERRFNPLHRIFCENYYGYGASPYLFVSLTFNGSEDIDTAWREVAKLWNSYITNLRQKFGRIEVVRCFEAQKRGYPHIHALLWFQERHFPYFAHKKTYRICDPDTLDRIKSAWHSGWADVQVFKSGKYAAEYLFKYITKTSDDSDSPQSRLNFALQWFYHKRSFSVSKTLTKLSRAFDLTRGQLLNSNSDPSELPEKATFLGLNTPSGFISSEQMRRHLPQTTEKWEKLRSQLDLWSEMHDFFKSCYCYSLLRRSNDVFNRIRSNGHLPV